jgi:hypothetical protein
LTPTGMASPARPGKGPYPRPRIYGCSRVSRHWSSRAVVTSVPGRWPHIPPSQDARQS